jgi:hypothetical protein
MMSTLNGRTGDAERHHVDAIQSRDIDEYVPDFFQGDGFHDVAYRQGVWNRIALGFGGQRDDSVLVL